MNLPQSSTCLFPAFLPYPDPQQQWSTFSDAGRDWGQEEKGTTEDEMAEWLH